MSIVTRTRWARTAAVASLSLAGLLSACGKDAVEPARPNIPGTPEPVAGLRRAAFIVDINKNTGQVRITQAENGATLGSPSGALVTNGVRGAIEAPTGIGGIRGSILAGDVVQLTASNYRASAVGAFTPGKVRVQVDINITNRLNGVELITPTFPTPPAGVSGVLLFPFEITVPTTSGGVSVGGDGTEVTFEQPNRGLAESSVDWDGDGTTGSGSPFNFFNDAVCSPTANDCYRWEAFAPVASGSTSEARTIGFDIDPTVGNFRARLIVAADLRNSGPPPVGTVAGSVTSPQRGALTGVTVNVSGGFTGTTAAAGAYSIADVNTGPRTVSLSNLPAGCTAPALQAVTVSASTTSTVDFSVTCSVPSGTITGSVLSSLGGGAAGTQVIVTPTGGTALAPVTASAAGAFTVAGVPVGAAGTGTIAFANLPAGCTNPGPQPYTGLTDGASISVGVTFTCTPPPAFYQYTSTWSAISGGQVTLTVRFNPSTRNDPNINGAAADDFTSIQGIINYPTARLQYVSGANGAGSPFQGITVNAATPGVLSWLNIATSAQPAEQVVAVFTFNVLAGAPGSASTTSTVSEIGSFEGGLFDLAFLQINEATLSLP